MFWADRPVCDGLMFSVKSGCADSGGKSRMRPVRLMLPSAAAFSAAVGAEVDNHDATTPTTASIDPLVIKSNERMFLLAF
jgi:hypothetical protein